MTKATDVQIDGLVHETGYRAEEGTLCFDNGLLQWLMLHIKGRESQIYCVNFPNSHHPEGEEDSHAYLVVDDIVYNVGVTYSTEQYPSYSLGDLKKVGEDWTEKILLRAFKVLYTANVSLNYNWLLHLHRADPELTRDNLLALFTVELLNRGFDLLEVFEWAEEDENT